MDGYSVWDEASRDYDSEARLVAQANLRVASTGVMQYLALAQTNDEFEGRLMLATASIQELSDSTGVPLDEVTASLRNRWEMLVEAGNVKLATNDPASAFRKIDFGMGKCGECGRVFDLFDPQQAEEWYSGHDCEPDSPNRQHEGSRKTASDGQCQNAGCEENAGIGGSYCNRCSMLTNASRKTAGDNDTCSCPCGCDAEDPDVCLACEFFGEHANKNNLPEYKDTSPIAEYNKRQKGNTTASRKTAAEDHHINDAMYHLIEDHDQSLGDILSHVLAIEIRARHDGHIDVGELLKEKHENEHASNIDHSHSSDEEDNPILQTGFDDVSKDTTASRRTAAGNVRKRNGMWVIIDKKSGNVLSSHQTRDEAVAASKRLHSDYKSLKVSSQSSSRLNFNKTAGADDCSEDHAISETYHDEPTKPQLAMYKKNNVPPAAHFELTDFFGVHAHRDIMNHVHQNSPNGKYNPEWGWQRTHRFSSFDPQIENDMG